MTVRFEVHLLVSLKDGLLDPQGKAVREALPTLGWDNVADVRVGKYLRMELDAGDAGLATQQAREMAERFLANPVIEDFRILEVHQARAGKPA